MQNSSAKSGLFIQTVDDGQGADSSPKRPSSMAWMTDELLDDTRRVWSKAYGRVISADEAVEILTNVKRFAEVLLKA